MWRGYFTSVYFFNTLKENEYQKNISSKLFLMCQMVVRDNKFENCDDGSAYKSV